MGADGVGAKTTDAQLQAEPNKLDRSISGGESSAAGQLRRMLAVRPEPSVIGAWLARDPNNLETLRLLHQLTGNSFVQQVLASVPSRVVRQQAGGYTKVGSMHPPTMCKSGGLTRQKQLIGRTSQSRHMVRRIVR